MWTYLIIAGLAYFLLEKVRETETKDEQAINDLTKRLEEIE